MVKVTADKVREIAKSCLASTANLNGIVSLLEHGESSNPEIAHAAITSLQFVFSKLVAAGNLDKAKTEAGSGGKSSAAGDSSAQKLAGWLRENRMHYLALLRETMTLPDPKLQIVSWDKYILMIKDATERVNEFQQSLFAPLVESLICPSDQLSSALLAKILDTLNAYDDLRFFFFRAASKIMMDRLEDAEDVPAKKRARSSGSAAQEPKAPVSIRSAFAIISKLRPAPSNAGQMSVLCEGSMTGMDNSKNNSLDRALNYQRAFSDCWLAFMRYPLPKDIYKAILESLHQKIIPHLHQPVLLMDFLVDAYNSGGIVSLLALNGVFTLIHEHNLDYPDFFAKLYALFDPSLLHYKYRARFFRLVELFLSSSYLPAYMVSAFVKRMARLCLLSPPAGIVMILPFIFNLLKKHPSCIRLIHSSAEKLEQMDDPFDFAELDPNKCGAQDSYLWEILALKQHAIHTVSGLARVFEDSLANPAYDLEDFMDHTFKTMVEAETHSKKRKRIQEEPPATAVKINPGWLAGSLWAEA
ncbi:CBF/Mak21 family-domain-containing protein [Entophlyctis helioformis]|nr:CBF/Mak21 family-domain-containing protein [Entophlyctis helioformis]